MAKIYRFLGKSGRTTIPYPMRLVMDLKRYDLISFELERDAIIVRKEKICDNCVSGRGQKGVLGAGASNSQKKQNSQGGRARNALKPKI